MALRVRSAEAITEPILDDADVRRHVALRQAEARVAVGKGFALAGPRVAASLVPGDQLVALADHCHEYGGAVPLVARDALALGDQLVADAAALRFRVHREHAEVRAPRLALDVRAGHQPAVLLREHDAAVRVGDRAADAFRVEVVGGLEIAGVGGEVDLHQSGRSVQVKLELDLQDRVLAKADGRAADIGEGEPLEVLR